MKRVVIAAVVVGLTAGVSTHAQTQPAQAQKTLASTIGIYVFPTQSQTASVQSKDEAACYDWAVTNTGSDPFQLSKQAQQAEAQKQQAAQSTQGSAVRGAGRGAAGGALIGAMAGNAGKGAAIGAATGAVVGRSRANRAADANQQQAAQVQQATAEQMENFKKAFSVCLEAKKYMVK